MDNLDKVQRIVIASAVAVGVVGIALTVSGVWTLPKAPDRLSFQNAPLFPKQESNAPLNDSSQMSEFELALQNSSDPATPLEELTLEIIENSLQELFALQEGATLSQVEGEKAQAQLIQREVEELLQKSTSPIVVPDVSINIAKDSGRETKLAYVAGIMQFEDDIKKIHAFLANPDNLSSEEEMNITVPAILPAYGRLLLAGSEISTPPVWADLHKKALHGLSAQSVGLSAILGFRSDPLATPYAIQTFLDGALEYKEAHEALIAQFKKEGFSVQ